MNYTEIEMEGMKDILRDKEEYIKKLESDKLRLEEENKKLDEAYQIARDRVIELLGDIEQYQKHIKELEEELKKDDREVQVDVDKELLKANDYLIKENKKLNELIFDINNQFEAYRKKMTDIEQELKNFLYKD